MRSIFDVISCATAARSRRILPKLLLVVPPFFLIIALVVVVDYIQQDLSSGLHMNILPVLLSGVQNIKDDEQTATTEK